MLSGVYKITNIINNKFYIGSTLGYKHTEKTKNKFKDIIQERKDNNITNKAMKLTYEDVFN